MIPYEHSDLKEAISISSDEGSWRMLGISCHLK